MALRKLEGLKAWHQYFSKNRLNVGDIPWGLKETLTQDERRCIGKSIAAFQLGEYSEGRSLFKFAQEYAARYDDEHLVEITQLFIREEQNHALLLKRFMGTHGMSLSTRNWTDTVFRRLRKNVGYELSVTVLITAEIIALVYYAALKECTASVVLGKICDKILADETAHVEYESEVLNCIRNAKPKLLRRAANLQHRILFFGTVLVVYREHRSVLKRGGYGLREFRSACWSEYRKAFGQKGCARITAQA
ncbi:MAG: hypothetical protein LC754_11515 [Acidobacteria bacterium]|nr:hypothetical protein [Acidobacteriota bacterium]